MPHCTQWRGKGIVFLKGCPFVIGHLSLVFGSLATRSQFEQLSGALHRDRRQSHRSVLFRRRDNGFHCRIPGSLPVYTSDRAGSKTGMELFLGRRGL